MSVHLILDQTNKVINRIEWDGVAPFTPPTGHTVVAGDGEIGWMWDGAAAVNPNPVSAVPLVADAPAGLVLSVSKQVIGGREVEFAYFRKSGDRIPMHTHDDGHFSVLVSGRVLTQILGTSPQVLDVVGQSVYFPAGAEHALVAEMDDSVCLQVHDKKESL